MKTMWFLVYMWTGVIPTPFATEQACIDAATKTHNAKEAHEARERWDALCPKGVDGSLRCGSLSQSSLMSVDVFARWDCIEVPQP